MALKQLKRVNGKELLSSARRAADASYSPYSKFPVGAALLTSDGTVVTGCNVENASYGLTVCAERAAIFTAIAENHRGILAIAIANKTGTPCYPCGACRQVIAEFADDNTIIIVESKSNGIEVLKFSSLLPHAFGRTDLES